MTNLSLSLICSLLFVYLLKNRLGQKEMLYIRVKKISMIIVMAILFSSVLCIAPTLAADAAATTTGGDGKLFADLVSKGIQIFKGMRDIIYVVAGFGIIAVAIGGFFGNINWKWLGAIIIGLMVIGLTGGILTYIGEGDAPIITDTLK